MSNRYDRNESRRIIQQVSNVDDANVDVLNQGGYQDPTRIEIDLSTYNGTPVKIPIPFKTLYVGEATDFNTSIQIQLSSDNLSGNYLPIYKGFRITNDRRWNNIYAKWTPQPGKKIVLYFFSEGKVDTGTDQVAITSAVDANNFIINTQKTTDENAIELIPLNFQRKKCTLKANQDILISQSPSGPNWFSLEAGYWVWSNTSAIYFKSPNTGFYVFVDILEEY